MPREWATPRLHRCKSEVALEQETFSRLPEHLPKKTTCSFSYRFRGNLGIRGLYQEIRIATLTKPFCCNFCEHCRNSHEHCWNFRLHSLSTQIHSTFVSIEHFRRRAHESNFAFACSVSLWKLCPRGFPLKSKEFQPPRTQQRNNIMKEIETHLARDPPFRLVTGWNTPIQTSLLLQFLIFENLIRIRSPLQSYCVSSTEWIWVLSSLVLHLSVNFNKLQLHYIVVFELIGIRITAQLHDRTVLELVM